MAPDRPQKLFSEVQAGKFKPVYYFSGSEDYRIVEAEKFVARQFLPDRQLTTNFRRFNARTTKCTDLLAELAVFPLLGDRQVFGVTSFQSYKPTEVDRVLKLIGQADPNRIIVLSSPSSKTPKKSSVFLKKVAAVAQWVEFNKLSPQEVRGAAARKFAQADIPIGQDALTLLVELVAGNRGALEVEVNKLLSYKDGEGEVGIEDVRRVCTGFQVYSVFELADFVVGGDRRGVLHQVKRLVADGNSPTGILYFLGQHFVSLYLVKNGRRLEPYRRWLEPRFRSQAARYPNDRLERMIESIALADADCRKGRLKPEMLLEQLVLELT
ncbi:MAG: DNA polymerase III subunit delta [candidate division Zixibacteria bacterium]|nr:DNA polymerase III subunit delta [candidate division Zixibacteria bacterium]